MKNIIITGVTGQDGSYLAELLLNKKNRVFGITHKKEKSFFLNREKNFHLITNNLKSKSSFENLILKLEPHEIYNFAGFSSGENMNNNPYEIGDLNGLAVTRILESIVKIDKNIRFCQASSSEIYGKTDISPQTELTPFKPRSAYGISKLYAHQMVGFFRENYGIFACSAILFNHTSPRQSMNFIVKKITHSVAMIKLGLLDKIFIGNLNAKRDWGYAKDYARAMSLMINNPIPDDYVISTGKIFSVRELCEIAFNYLDLDYKNYINYDKSSYRPDENFQLIGDPSKIKTELGWKHTKTFHEIIALMIDKSMSELNNKKKFNENV
jgi:GDPmannose 4,6-dehydratase